MKKRIIKLLNNIRTDDDWSKTPKMFTTVKSWGRKPLAPVLMLALSFFSLSSVSALTYSSDVDLNFTINPSVSVAVSGDLTIDNLAPGNTADSNDITITASTNYIDGLILTGTVGNSTDTNPSHNNTSLTHTNGTNTFTSLLPTASYSNLNDNAITTNTWGYATKPTSGDNQTWSSYSGLPIYNDASGGTVLLTATTLGTNTLLFKIGAKSLSTQVAGTYTNTINFTATTRIVTTNYTISYTDTTSEATNLPANQAGTITAPTYVNLSQTVPERASYSFVGWCSVNNSSDPSTCTGTTYQPGDAITVLNPGGSLTIPLYAVWEVAGETWLFNEYIDRPSASHLEIDFISNSEQFTEMFYDPHHNGIEPYFVGEPSQGVYDSTMGGYGGCNGIGWCNEAYRTITITGGTDADDPSFRSWLSENATRL